MTSGASTVEDYIRELPSDRRDGILSLRRTILQHLPVGFEEIMLSGMISYVVPLSTYVKGYHVKPGTPLSLISLASQKNYLSMYHMALYQGPLLDWFVRRWSETVSYKLDMGRCCVRFSPGNVPLELIGELAGRLTPKQWVDQYEKALASARTRT